MTNKKEGGGTIRQRKLAEKMVQSLATPGTKKAPSLGQLMIEAGYSKSMAHNPNRIIRSQAFQQLLKEKGITESNLADLWTSLMKAPVKEKEMDWNTKFRVAKEMSEIYGVKPEKQEVKFSFQQRVNELLEDPEEGEYTEE